MCGIAGFLGGLAICEPYGVEATLQRMTSAIAHRGPDDVGHWVDADAKVGLAHRRLSIVDLSSAGHQPMASASGRYLIAFNGEIYNHLTVRESLDDLIGGASLAIIGIRWRGHSDTETLLAGFDRWGIQGTLERAIGMFAFAVWDRQTNSLTLARDRLGEKPLYYGWQGAGSAATFLFGSELKALRAHPAFEAAINRDALCLYMRHTTVPGSLSIYRGIHKLAPGTLLTVSMRSPEPLISTYWSGADVAERGIANPFVGTAMEAVDALECLLKDAVNRQMMADVPLGAFLSGGVDSSAIVALMQAQSDRPIKTFTIGFHEAEYNEAEHAKAVARHLGTEHTELYVTPGQAMEVIPRLPMLYDEPFADSSQIPTFLVSQLARQHVTVALSGDAGDELFCGYSRYQHTARLWNMLAAIPLPLRRAVAWGLTTFSPRSLNRMARFLPMSAGWANPGDKLHKGAAVMTGQAITDLYLGMVSSWNDPGSMVIGGKESATLLTGHRPKLAGLSDIERMMALDMLTYLPEDILTKVDRAAMGVGLETRVPFLDHRVVEFAWQLPLHYKLRRQGQGYTTKWILRRVLHRYVPKHLIERPKMGFGVPIDVWLRGPLRGWAEDLLSEARLKREGYFLHASIRQKWAQHLSGQRNWQSQLWCVLMFQAWLAEQSTPTAD